MAISHEQAVAELAEHLRPVFEHSPDGVYVWLDERNARCNQNLADLFGCTVEEWERTEDFLGKFVEEADRQTFAWRYQGVVAELGSPLRFRFHARRKDGTPFEAETDIIPLTYGGHPLAYHFVRAV